MPASKICHSIPMNTPESSSHNPPPAPNVTLRPHSFDGIQEFDQRLPRWWLLTLYGAIIFSVLYWGYYHTYGLGDSRSAALEKEMARNAALLARKASIVDDATLWKMAQEPAIVAAGKATFETTCAACHKPDLTGLIGPNLVDHQWIHGGLPMDAVKTIQEGVAAKGMPSWAAVLGPQKIHEVAAYIFSHHQPGEEIIPVTGWTPPGAPAPTPTP